MQRVNNGDTPLHWAVDRGHTETVRALIAAGADVNAQNERGYPPLHWAASRGHTETVRALIELRAEVNARDEHGSTPLYRAAQFGHTEIVSLLEAAAAAGGVEETKAEPAELPMEMTQEDIIPDETSDLNNQPGCLPRRACTIM